MVSQSSDPPAGSPPAGDDTTGADGESTRIRSLDERFKSIEAKQDAQQSTLEKILDALPGGHSGDDDQGDGTTTGADEPAQRTSIGAEVRRQIAEADARRAAEEKDAEAGNWRKSIDEAIEALKTERAPREPQTGIKGRLQRAMFGRPE